MFRKFTIGSCFSGIGGLELGLERTDGFETKWQIEIDPYASAVLAKHWPDVKQYSDIRDVVRPEPVDVICGGFPCQDVSLAGARAGLEGKRSTLWSEMFRLICEVKPRWVVAENVPGLLSSDNGQFFGNILRDLAGAGYDAEWGVLSAAGVGAPHLRKRVFIMAHTNNGGLSQQGLRNKQSRRTKTIGTGKDVADPLPTRKRRVERESEIEENANGNAASAGFSDRAKESMGKRGEESQFKRSDWWSVEPNVGRVAHGVSHRVDRLKCLGNAVVPQVAQKVGEMILKVTNP